MFLIKIYIDLEKTVENTDSSLSFYDFFKKKRNITTFDYNNLLNDIYIILNHNEYMLKPFFKELVCYTNEINYKNKRLLFVNTEKESDIKIYNISTQSFYILNKTKNKSYFFGIESYTPIPYLTGLYMKSNIEINNKRKYLLGYIGGVWRGERDNVGKYKRKLVIDKLKAMNSDNDNTLFYWHLV